MFTAALFTAALFTTAKTWNQPKCPSMIAWIKKMLHINHGILCSYKKQNSVVSMCHIFLIQSIIDGHLGWFQVFTIVNTATINIRVHVPL